MPHPLTRRPIVSAVMAIKITLITITAKS